MKELFAQLFQKRYTLPRAEMLDRAVRSFSPVERVLFGILCLLFALGTLGLLYKINALFLVEVPSFGGTVREGIVGSPRFINPLLALSDADRDLSALIYSGLLKATPEGTLVPDLAEAYEISADGLSYTFTLREDARFHDKVAVTADDVVFTIQKAQDPALKSPKRANWEGIAVEKLGERSVKLTLKQPYPPFLENAALGILPKRLWKEADAEQFPFSERNIAAVGSGPYRIGKVKRNGSGIPMLVELVPFEEYALGAPSIARFVFRFYQNERELLAALTRGEIESASAITPEQAVRLDKKGRRIERTPLPRVFAVFFNQNQAPILADASVRKALSLAVDRERLVSEVLFGYGVPVLGPVPPLLLGGGRAGRDAETPSAHEREEQAREKREQAEQLLDAAKWTRQKESGMREKTKGKLTEPLSFSVQTANIPELQESAERLKAMWRDIGAEVTVQIFESGDLNQNVIRPRRYDALLFGEVIGRDLDLFAFWHSSQRNDPGLNVALYTNAKVDKLLEEARRSSSAEKRLESHQSAVAAIERDHAAVFLYAPEFIYVAPRAVRGLRLSRVTIPSERFLNVHEWYINTEKVWSIFTK
ncbi:MAG: peptide ABC transporter substrate-binding protein [Patescibacteria group bacterium]